MRITKVKLTNFRSFNEHETSILLDDFTTFIGSNSSGKTAAINALLKIFGTSSKERELKRSDFHVPKGIVPESIDSANLRIEVIIEFPELSTGGDETQYTIPTCFENMVVAEAGSIPYLRMRLSSTWTKGNTPEGDIESKLQYILVPEGSVEDEKELMDVKSHERSHIHMIYVPAVRDPLMQLKNASGTVLWRILKKINWPEDLESQLKDKIKDVEAIFDEQIGVKVIKNIIDGQWKNYHRDYRYTDTNIRFNSTDLDTILQKIEVDFTPTEIPGSYKVDFLGDGLRSLFYLSLITSLLQVESSCIQCKYNESKEVFDRNWLPPALTILAVEEPECHVSPMILGRIIDNLKQSALNKSMQTIITSHAPSIVKRIEPENIRHFRICKDSLSTSVNSILLPSALDEAYKYIKEAIKAYPEIYFARLVVLGEGDSEELIIPRIIELLGPSLDGGGISVVPLGGAYVNHFWKLLSNLNIPFVTLLDFDLERYGGGWGRVKYVINQLTKISIPLNTITTATQDQVDSMHTTQINANSRDAFRPWLEKFKEHNVFFSYPLDLDFMMLKAYKDKYISTVPAGYGPRIPNEQTNAAEFNDRLQKDIRSTLKAEGGQAVTYDEDEKKLMIWYNYLFLGRGKPSTHILALSEINDQELSNNLPDTLKDLMNRVQQLLKDDVHSDISLGG